MENTHTYIVGKNFINSHNYHYTSSDCFPFFLALLNVCGRVTRHSCQVQENSIKVKNVKRYLSAKKLFKYQTFRASPFISGNNNVVPVSSC